MKLSIIVPVFNQAGGNLEFCLDSLLAQTITDYEIIAVNDKSTDNSLEILEEYGKKNPDRIRVINLEHNIKQGGARNVGIQHSKGEFIGYVDSDDWVAPDMYEKLLKKASNTGADVVFCDMFIKHHHNFEPGQYAKMIDDNIQGILYEEQYKKLVLRSGSIVCKIYKRELIIENGLWFPENVFYEDNCTGVLMMMYATHLEKVDIPLYYYYTNPFSTTHIKNDNRMFDRLVTAELLVEEFKKRGFYNRYKEELLYRFVELYYANTLQMYKDYFSKLDYSRLLEMKKKKHDIAAGFSKNKYKKYLGKKRRIFMGLNDISPWLYIAAVYIKRFIKNMRVQESQRRS